MELDDGKDTGGEVGLDNDDLPDPGLRFERKNEGEEVIIYP